MLSTNHTMQGMDMEEQIRFVKKSLSEISWLHPCISIYANNLCNFLCILVKSWKMTADREARAKKQRTAGLILGE